METKKDRLVKYLKYKGFENVAEFSKFLGLHQDHVGKVDVKGSSGKLHQKLAELCPDLNLTWVITGKGTMLETLKEEHPEMEHLRALFEAVYKVLPDSYSLIKKNDIVTSILRDLREGEEGNNSDK